MFKIKYHEGAAFALYFTIAIISAFLFIKAVAHELDTPSMLGSSQNIIINPSFEPLEIDPDKIVPFKSYAQKQIASVKMDCFPQELKNVLTQISLHFGEPVIVTSGHRPGGRGRSMHKTCQAADIQINGVSGREIVAFAKTIPAVGGIGTYSHTKSVHIDIRATDLVWHNRRSIKVARNSR